MAVVRGRSAPPYATIIFVFLWVIATGVAIWLAVQKGDLEKKVLDADKQKAAALKTNESSNTALQGMKNIVEANGQMTAAEVSAKATKTLEDTGNSSKKLISAIEGMHATIQQQIKTIAELQAQKTQTEGQLAQSTQGYSASLAAANASLNTEKAAHAAAEATAAKERADKEALLSGKEADLTKAKDAAEQERRQLILQIDQMKQDTVAKQNTIDILRQQLQDKHPKGGTLAGMEPAGTVVRAHPGTSECYISLGRKDRVVPGLTFSVHDPRIGVKVQADTDIAAKPDPEAGGKGGIEVVEVGENESLCRVSFLKKGQHLEPGDLIANPVFQRDKTKKYHFVVMGDFDLDGDGVATPSERDRLVRMITSWGGVVDEALSPETDYLVLGTRPAAPSGKVSDQAGGVADERIRVQKAYDDVFTEAKRSSVPILNGNRFLATIGYYNTTVVH